MSSDIRFESSLDVVKEVRLNFSDIFIQQTEKDNLEDNYLEYQQFLTNIWLGIFLALIPLSCICFLCSSSVMCYRFKQWRRRFIQARNGGNLESGIAESELPSYTIASGLPTYEEALQQLQVKDPPFPAKPVETSEWIPHTPPTPAAVSLNVVKFFQGCGASDNSDLAKDT